jgi:UDP-GlcNAc:undecaprenyl-phosphate GlcNAc-1-phosphate transferase
MVYLTITFLSFLFTIFFTPYYIDFLKRKGIVDKPDSDRRVNTEPIPRMGGLIIYAVLLVIVFAFYGDVYIVKYFITGSLIIFIIGLIDDLKPQRWFVKFAFQSVAAVFVILFLSYNNYSEIQFLGIKIPVVFDKIILFFFIVGSINAFNLLDGLDGLTTGLTLIVASLCLIIGLAGDFIFLPVAAAALIGSSLGFLKFNANPAQIFLGDTGSLTFGYFTTAAILTAAGEVNNHVIDLAFPIIVLAVPLFDTLRVMTSRIMKRVNPFLPDHNHIHHIILGKNIRHKTSVFIIQGFILIFTMIGLIYVMESKFTGFILFILMLILFISAPAIIGFIIKKDHLLFYGRSIKRFPEFLINIYKKHIIPFISIAVTVFMFLLMMNESVLKSKFNLFFLIFIFLTIVYSLLNYSKKRRYSEVIVLINLILFFIITGLNGTFYNLYHITASFAININQLFILVLFPIIIFYLFFRDRMEIEHGQFLTGVDLIIALTIGFVLVSFQFIEITDGYKISDTLLRSYLIYLLYKIVIRCFPKLQVSLYFSSFIITIMALSKSLF